MGGSASSRACPEATDAIGRDPATPSAGALAGLPEGVSVLEMFRELRAVAQGFMARERPGTLQPTALVNEALLRLMGSSAADVQQLTPRDFFARACRCMSRVLVDQARRRNAVKRTRVPGDDTPAESLDPPRLDVLVVQESLERLDRISPGAAELVRLRFFVGLSVLQAAEAMQVSVSTAESHWRFARACLGCWLAQD